MESKLYQDQAVCGMCFVKRICFRQYPWYHPRFKGKKVGLTRGVPLQEQLPNRGFINPGLRLHAIFHMFSFSGRRKLSLARSYKWRGQPSAKQTWQLKSSIYIYCSTYVLVPSSSSDKKLTLCLGETWWNMVKRAVLPNRIPQKRKAPMPWFSFLTFLQLSRGLSIVLGWSSAILDAIWHFHINGSSWFPACLMILVWCGIKDVGNPHDV